MSKSNKEPYAVTEVNYKDIGYCSMVYTRYVRRYGKEMFNAIKERDKDKWYFISGSLHDRDHLNTTLSCMKERVQDRMVTKYQMPFSTLRHIKILDFKQMGIK